MDKLKQAKESLVRMPRGSAGRESAEKSRELKRMLRERSGIQGRVEVVPNAGGMMMPNKRSMMREGMMDMANKPEAAFGREMARERKKQQRENY